MYLIRKLTVGVSLLKKIIVEFLFHYEFGFFLFCFFKKKKKTHLFAGIKPIKNKMACRKGQCQMMTIVLERQF